MRNQLLYFILLVFVTACAPSQEIIQPTVQAAIAQTNAAEPTSTSIPSPVPITTPSPSSTPGLEQLIDRMNTTIRLLEGPTRVVDIRYLDRSEGLILQVDAKSTAEEYDERDIVADVFTALDRSYEGGFLFQENLFALRVVGYDMDLERQGALVSEWADMVAWFEDEITTEQLILRLILRHD